MFKITPGAVNGDIIGDLLKLCNDQFNDPFEQDYESLKASCLYCDVWQKENGQENHLESCPVTKYEKIAEKHKLFIGRI